MPGWVGSNRKQELPPNWQSLRVLVLEKFNYKCQNINANTRTYDYEAEEWVYEVCGEYANQVDHKVPGPDHSMSNLQALCEYHHKKKSSSEGGKAKAAKEAAAREAARKLKRHPAYKRQ